MSFILAAALIAIGMLAIFNLQPAQAQREGGTAAGAHYTVVATEGHNLIVTDNHTNTLYFYTIDPDKEIGSDLKVRGHVDLNQIGKPVIKPVTHKNEQ